MIIYVPLQLKQTGGTSTFGRSLQQALAPLGHQVAFTPPASYDVVLVVASAPLRMLVAAKRRGIPIIQRLDGIHSPTTVARWQWRLYNAPLQLTRAVADAVIYQSEFSRRIVNQFFGTQQRAPEYIIYNGVDTTVFCPDGPTEPLRDRASQHVIFTAQRFRRQDQMQPLIAAVELYRQRYHADTKLVIAGDFVAPLPPQLPRTFPQWVTCLGPLPHDRLARAERAADVFVYCHPNPAGPNNVLEALASGLPVVGVADGAMPEVVRAGSGLLVPPHGDGLFTPRTFSIAQFAAAIHTILHRQEPFSTAARRTAIEHFPLTTTAQAYDAVLTTTQRRSGLRSRTT